VREQAGRRLSLSGEGEELKKKESRLEEERRKKNGEKGRCVEEKTQRPRNTGPRAILEKNGPSRSKKRR